MKIVFLEDDLYFAASVVSELQSAGHEVDHFSAGRVCLKAIHQTQYDLALLDWEVPDMSGKEVMENLQIKGNAPPVVFLTGRDAEEDVVDVIESGADDYIVKPPNMKILLARINALYRRANPQANESHTVQYGKLSIDFLKRKFEIDEVAIKLTEKEADLAICFFRQIGMLLPRAHISKVVWGSNPDLDTRTMDVHISHLRSKLKLLPEHGWRLASVYHQGYRLERLI